MTGAASRSVRFVWGLGGIAVGGLGIRVAYVLTQRRDHTFGGDAYFYHASANLLAEGKAFISPWLEIFGIEVPAAEHPPLYSLFLAVPSVFGLRSVLTHILWSCVLGTATIVVVGLLGRAIANHRVGLIAAAVIALYPNTWAPDGALEAETLAMFLTALALLLTYRYLARPSWPRMAALGVVCGAAALTRSELLLFVPGLIVPLAFLTPGGTPQSRRRALGAGVLAAVVVMAPWIGFNLTRFEHPVYLSTQFEPLLASANCDQTYYGALIGYFSIPCVTEIQQRVDLADAPEIDQSQQSVVYGREAREYITGHLSRLPVVVAARLGRIAGLYKPGQMTAIDSLFGAREPQVARAGVLGFWILAPMALAGAIVLRRRRVWVFPFGAVIGVVVLTVAVTYANLRFRAPAEVVVATLAAVAADSMATSFVRRRRARRMPDVRAEELVGAVS